MALYTITRTCGHVEEIQIYGTNVHGERERRADREATRQCRSCYEAQQAKRDAEASADWPALTGTDRQIAWATTIRAKLLGELEAEVRRGRLGEQAWPIWRDAALRHTAAAWWIDHRNTGPALTIIRKALTTDDTARLEALRDQ